MGVEESAKADWADSAAISPAGYTLGQLAGYMLRLGTVGFGGPVALVGYMHRDLVERRKWFSEAEYKEGLALAQLMPGPLAAQLAIYLGYIHHRFLGATLAGVGFVVPSFVMVVVLGWAYLAFGGLPWMQAVFYGVGPSVIGIITLSAYKLTRKTIGRDWLFWLLFLTSAVATITTESESVLMFLGAGLLSVAVRAYPRRAFRSRSAAILVLPLGMGTSEPGMELGKVIIPLTLFFAKAGAFVFGSGLAIVPFLYSGVVKEYGWLNEQEFLDAVAVAMITPGPVVITVGFIGYIVTGRGAGHWSGLVGASAAAFATFLPCFLLTVLPAPWFKKYGNRPSIVAFVDGVTAAAVGAIAGACVVLGRRTLIGDALIPEVPKALLLLATLGLLLRYKKLQEPLVVLGAAVVGLLVHPLVHP